MSTLSAHENKEMIAITFPDGAIRDYVKGSTGLDIAATISKSLAKDVLALWFDDKLIDANIALEKNGSIKFLTKKDPESLELIRHDTAHLLAEAVKELFPETQVTIGPAIENGFYYDFYREKPFTTDDLEVIEKKMKHLVDRNEIVMREEWDRNEAIAFFENEGEYFKAEIIRDLPEGETISLYRQGNFIDLCRGPHAPSTSKIGKSFKLTKVSGAYWRGDSNNQMLQRIYGTAWRTDKELEAYLFAIAEAEKRDHRKLGPEMALFHQQEEAAGNVFWHPKGWTLFQLCQDLVRNSQKKYGYVEVRTPQILDKSLWEASGHWSKFRENMYTIEAEEKVMAVKPMNCPCHVQIFKKGIKSYRDLPLRMAEFGSCHRNEPSGALHGLMRVRAFTQDDAHIFCMENQIAEETKLFCQQLQDVYKVFGFEDILIKFADRPETRAGSDEIWDRAEAALKEASLASGLDIVPNPGEGAFYGPKLEFVLKDALGREWQCGTLQVDFVLPERLDSHYIGEDGNKHRPVMLHRAILGSFERFLAILIEHYGGKFPLWLAPVQVAILTITEEATQYAEKTYKTLTDHGFRCEIDLRNEKISYKIREHSLSKTPLLFVVGKKEVENNSVAIRQLGSKDQRVLSLEDAINTFKDDAQLPKV